MGYHDQAQIMCLVPWSIHGACYGVGKMPIPRLVIRKQGIERESADQTLASRTSNSAEGIFCGGASFSRLLCDAGLSQ